VHRPIVIAGNAAQFADWCRRFLTNPVAAEYVESPEQLASALERTDDVRLWGDCTRNPAFRAYLTWRQSHRMRLAG